MSYVALNNAYSTLAAALGNNPATDLSIVVAAGHGNRFAVGSDYTYLWLEKVTGETECVKVTAQAGDTLTIPAGGRAQDGTSILSWSIGDIIECRPCHAAVEAIKYEAAAATEIHAATSKATPVDADEISLVDSAASWVMKKFTWANLKAGVFAAWGVLINAGTAKAVPVDADAFAYMDSAASNATKKLTWANLKAALVDTALTWAKKITFSTSIKIQQVLEKITVTASAPTGTFDCLTQAIQYFTSNATANWTQNFRGDGSNSLNDVMAIGESITVTILAAMGTTGYLPTTIQVDGSTVTAKYLGGSAWTADASCVDAFTFTIIKTADATFSVFASKTKYA